MHVIRKGSPQEAVLSWLKAELYSERFKNDLAESLKQLNLTETLITNPDLEDADENVLRYKVLKNYRDWLEDDLEACDWSLVEYDKADVEQLEYIDYSYWNELSDQTHKVGVAAKNIENGKVVFDVPNDRFWSVAHAFENSENFEPIIVLKDATDRSPRIIEGHVRATAYSLAKQPPKQLRAMLGIAR